MSKIFIRYGSYFKAVNKEELFKFLAKRVLDKKYQFCFYNSELKEFYENTYDLILKRLDEITCIQIYKDNVLRLHLSCGYFDSPKFIFLEDDWLCTSEEYINMINDLISFSKYN